MSFDEAFKREAEAFFDARHPLEIRAVGSAIWEPLPNGDIADLVFSDRMRAVEIAMPHGIGLSDGRRVRFAI